MDSPAAYFWIFFAFITCGNLPFLISDLVFAASGNLCTIYPVPNISFTLQTWLEVDGYLRLSIVILFLLIAILSCWNIDCALMFLYCAKVFMFFYSLFNFSWLIVGSVMFWGYLNDQAGCNGTNVADYMFAVLIIGFIGTCLNCFCSCKS